MTMTSLGEAVLEVFRHWLTEHHRQFVENTQKMLYWMRRRLTMSTHTNPNYYLPAGHPDEDVVRFAMSVRQRPGPGF